MWFRLGLKSFIGKKNISDDGCDLFVSDFISIWHKSLSDHELVSISKKLNPLFEASVQKIREVTLNLFDEDEIVHKEVEEESNQIILKLEANRMGVKFRFHVVLLKGDGGMLYKEFTLPLIALIVRLQNREKKVIQMIKDKDAEIREYKQDHSMIKTSFAATKPFCEKDVENDEFIETSVNSIANDPSSFLHIIDKKLFTFENQLVIKEDKMSSKDEEEEKVGLKNECDKKNLVFKKKNISISSGSEPCVKMGHQIIKKRKKNTESFRIKL